MSPDGQAGPARPMPPALAVDLDASGGFDWLSGGVFETHQGGDWDGFVIKLDADGNHLWSTYLGGVGNDYAKGVAVDDAGNIYVMGWTKSGGWVTGGADASYNGGEDAYVVKLSSNGQTLMWGSYLGGAADDRGRAIAVDGGGQVTVVGETQSVGWVSGGYDTSHNGQTDVFVARLTADGQTVSWSTYLGADGQDYAEAAALAGGGDVLIGGRTTSTGWVAGGYDTSYGGAEDGFVSRLSASGQVLQWSTYLGGTNLDRVYGLTVAANGDVIAAGQTRSTGWISGGLDQTYGGGGEDGFIVRLTSAGAHAWSTYVGGSGSDRILAVAEDGDGRVIVGGETNTSSGWIAGGPDTTHGGGYDGFVAAMSGDGQAALWSTYVGGGGGDRIVSVAPTDGPYTYAGGYSGSSDWVIGTVSNPNVVAMKFNDLPDLIVQPLAETAVTVFPGSLVQIDVTIENVDMADAESTAVVRLFLSQTSPPTRDLDDVVDGWVSGILPAGGQETRTLSFYAPQTTGTYYLAAYVDDLGQVAETSESNNWGPVIRLTVEIPMGDLNVDGQVNLLDIDSFTLAVSDPTAWSAAHPGVDLLEVGDFNGDGSVNLLDTNRFTAAIQGLAYEPAIEVRLVGGAVVTALAIGEVNLRETATQTLAVQNIGALDLTISPIADLSAVFRISPSTGPDANGTWVLSTHETIYLDVTFEPGAPGTYEATLTLGSDDPDDAVYEIALTGTGARADEPVVELSVGAEHGVTEVQFGTVELDQTVQKTLVVTNLGAQDLVVSDVAVSAGSFSIAALAAPDGAGQWTLGAGASISFIVTFQAGSVGALGSTLTVTSNDPDNGQIDVALAGEGILSPDGDIAVDVLGGELNVRTIDFGAVYRDDLSARTLLVRNAGQSTLTVSTATLSDSGFSIDPVNGLDGADDWVLEAGESMEVTVTFAPNHGGRFSGLLRFVSNDPNEANYDIALAGWGGGLGDANVDGRVSLLDISPFVTLVTDRASYVAAHPTVNLRTVGDFNGDGEVNLLDIDGFMSLIGGGAG